MNTAKQKNDWKKILRTCLVSYSKVKGNYAGFKSRSAMADFLKQEMFGFGSIGKLKNKKIDAQKTSQLVRQTIQQCQRKVTMPQAISTHCFPSYNQFINKRMRGVSGYTSNQKNILLFLSPQPGWQRHLQYPIAHEYAHLLAYTYHPWKTLLDSLIFEGIAEHFREVAIGGPKAAWVKAISPKQSHEIFKKISKKLNSVKITDYNQLFFGAERKYPLWAGYALGYEIIKSFRNRYKNIPWLKIVQKTPKSILTESSYK